jgi:DNA-directed RNA polymerase subunit omega
MDLPDNIESKFRFILVAAKRARQLQSGARPLVQTPSKKVTRVAQAEVLAGLVPIETTPLPEEDAEVAEKTSKSR